MESPHLIGRGGAPHSEPPDRAEKFENRPLEPTNSFQAYKLHFWFSVYIDGVEIVDGACIADFLGNLQ